MAGKVYEIAFEIASNLSSKFKSSFRQASASAEALAESISSISGRAGQIEAIKKMRREVLEGARAYSNARQRATELGRAVGQMTRKNKTLEAALNAEKAALAQLRAAYGSNNAALKSVEYQAAKDRVKQLSDEYAAAVVQSRNLTAEFEAARGACNDAEAALQAQRVALRQAERETGTLGVSTRDLDDETNRLERETRELAERQEQLARSAEVAAARQRRLDTINEGLARTNDRLSRASGNVLTAYGNIISMGTTIAGPLVGAAKAAMEFEDAMADVKKVVNFDEATNEAGEFAQAITEMSNRIPIASNGLAAIAAAAGQSGIAKKDILAFTEQAAKMGVAFDITAEQAGEMMSKWRSGMGLTQEQTNALADATNELANNNAAAAAEIGEVLQRYGALGKMSGLNEKQLAAMAATTIGAGASAETATTGIKAFMKMLSKGASMSSNQAAAFEGIGLDPEQIQKDLQKDGPKAIVETLKTIKSRVPEERINEFLGVMFGDEAAVAIGPMLGNLELLEKNFALVADSTSYAGSMQKEFTARSGTASNSIQLAKNAAGNFASTIGELLLPHIKDLSAKFVDIAGRASKWASENKELVITGLKVAAAVGGLIIGLNALAILFNVVIWPAMKLYQGFLLLKKAIFITRGAMVALRSSTLAAAVANKILTARIVAASLGAKMAALPTKLLGIAQKGAAVGARALGLAMKAIPIVALISAFITACVYADKLKQGWEWLKAKTLELWNTFAEKFPFLAGYVQTAFGPIIVWVRTIIDVFMELINAIKNVFSGEWEAAWQNVKNIFVKIWEGMKDTIKVPLNGIIRMINSISFTVPDWVPVHGGKTFSPNIPMLANGGIATRATQAIIGEGSEPEAVMPLSKLDNLLSTNGGAGGISINFAPVINVSGGGDVYGEVTRGLEAGRESLKRELERLLRDQRRVSYA